MLVVKSCTPTDSSYLVTTDPEVVDMYKKAHPNSFIKVVNTQLLKRFGFVSTQYVQDKKTKKPYFYCTKKSGKVVKYNLNQIVSGLFKLMGTMERV